MGSVMGICGGLVGPKSGNVDFSLVLTVLFLWCQEGPEDGNRANRQASRAVSMSKK